GEAGPPPGYEGEGGGGGPGSLPSRRHRARCPGLLCLCRPAEPRYEQGLLSGLHRSPHARRFDTDGTAEPDPGVLLPGSARATVLCLTDVAPEPRSCRVLPGAPGALQCKVDVTVSLDPVERMDA
ncbi:neuropeptide B, partial [Aptenodytes patagonicus]|uniref:neuropeptide B n=1 Tax=Aptenodytes patagonicus TaxID=9234 RepID=UPI003F9F7CAD